MTTKVV